MDYDKGLYKRKFNNGYEVKRYDYCYSGVEIFEFFNFDKFKHNANGCLHRKYKCSTKLYLMNRILVDLFEMILNDLVSSDEVIEFKFPSRRGMLLRVNSIDKEKAMTLRQLGKYKDFDLFQTNFNIYNFSINTFSSFGNKEFTVFTNTSAYKDMIKKANTGHKF